MGIGLATWSVAEVLLALGIVAVGALVHGAVGMGLGLVAAPVLLMIDPVFVPGPMLCCALFLTLLMINRERRAVDLFGLTWGIVGRLIGTAIASLLLVRLPEGATSVVAAALILAAVVLSLLGLDVEPNQGLLIGAGTVSGIMSTLASVGGPPLALLYQRQRGPRLRATLSGFFILGTVISLIGLALVGNFGLPEIKATALLLPAIVVGFLLSSPALPLLDRGYTRTAVLLVSAASSLVLLVRTLG
jgi:uncharacterized membrane protein YfcA